MNILPVTEMNGKFNFPILHKSRYDFLFLISDNVCTTSKILVCNITHDKLISIIIYENQSNFYCHGNKKIRCD